MKYWLCCALLLLLVYRPATAQNHLDSLWSAWENTANSDEDRSKALLLLSRTKTGGGPILQFENPLAIHRFAVREVEQLDAPKNLARMYQTMAKWYFIAGKPDSSFLSLDKSDSIYLHLNDTLSLASNFQNRGTVYSNLGELDKAQDATLKAADLFQRVGAKSKVATAFQNIGAILLRDKEFYKARSYFEKSIALHNQLGETEENGMALQNLGLTYRMEDDYEKALTYFKEALEITSLKEKPRGYAMIIGNVSELYNQVDSLEKAYAFGLEALEVRQQLGNKRDIGTSLLVLGQIANKQNKHQLAIDYGKKALAIYENTQNWTNLVAAEEILYLNYEKLGLHEQALKYHKLFFIHTDSMNDLAAKRELLSTQLDWEYKQQRRQDSLANATERALEQARFENEEKLLEAAQRQNLIMLIALATVGGILLLLMNRYRYTRRQNQLIEKQRGVLAEQNINLQELSDFKRSMTSMLIHDLKNPLNVILGTMKSATTKNTSVEKSARIMMQLVSNLLDINKHEDAHLVLSLAEREITDIIDAAVDQVTVFAKDQQLNLESQYQTKSLVYADHGLVERVLVNMLTNAIRFSPSGGTVIIRVRQGASQSGSLRIEVEDHGLGISKADQERIFERNISLGGSSGSGYFRSSGLGLAFCKIAVEAHGGTIGVESVLGKGSIFWFELPADHSTFQLVSEQKWLLKADLIQSISPEGKAFLQPVVTALKALPFYNVSALTQHLNDLAETTTDVEQWKAAVLQSIYDSNETEFNRLVTLIDA